MAYLVINGTALVPTYKVNKVTHRCTPRKTGCPRLGLDQQAEAQAHGDACEVQKIDAIARDVAWFARNPNVAPGALAPSQRGEFTLSDVWKRYKRLAQIELTTLEGYASYMDRPGGAIAMFGGMKPAEITFIDVADWIEGLQAKGVTPPTVRAMLRSFGAVMSYAIDKEFGVPRNHVSPCKGHTLTTVKRERTDADFALTDEQWDQLAGAWETEGLRLMTLSMVVTGARTEEVVAFLVRSHNVKTNKVHIERRLTWPMANEERGHPGGVVEHEDTKNHDVRKFTVAADYMQAIDAWVTKHGLKKGDVLFPPDLVLPKRHSRAPISDSHIPELTPEFVATLGKTAPNAKGYTYRHGTVGGATNGRCTCDYCRVARRRYDRARHIASTSKVIRITPMDRKYLSYSTFHEHWTRAAKTAGLSKDELRYPVTPHCLRHTYATALADAGIPSKEIQRRLGHAHIETTEGYIHGVEHADELAGMALVGKFKMAV